jgi:hypothetical protein
VESGGTLEMNAGSKISGNTTFHNGGGVAVYNGGTFIMSGGDISGNTANSYGGGVYGTFTMSGGAISGNTAYHGGGVYVVYVYGTFTKESGGVIYGSNASDDLKNTAKNGTGHAVYVHDMDTEPNNKTHDTTAGEGVTLYSTKGDSAGDWE